MARLGTEDHARLDRLLAATVQALALGGPAIARRVYGVQLDMPGIDGFVRATRLLRDGPKQQRPVRGDGCDRRVTQDIGLDQFKPFLRRAEEHLAG